MCFSVLGTAQEVSFHYVKYATKNGLPSSEVYEILQDREGLIWVCSDAGVARFNGYEFESFTTNDGLADNTVFHFYEDFKGRVWFLSYSSKLCYYEKGIIHSYKYNDKLIKHLPNERIRAISIDENETITFVGSLDTKLLDSVICQLLGTKEFFINKAIGWVLREYSRTNPEWVIDFAGRTALSNLSRREALRLLKD